MSFTPPFTVRPERLADGQHVAGRGPEVVDLDGRVICRLPPGEEATAALFAAAPYLLNACRAYFEQPNRCNKLMSDALAKAEATVR